MRDGSRTHRPEDADMAEDHEVRIFAGRWSAAERAEILAELSRRDIPVTVDGDDIVVPRHRQREIDMIVESVTEE
jgi:hypothetical protein